MTRVEVDCAVAPGADLVSVYQNGGCTGRVRGTTAPGSAVPGGRVSFPFGPLIRRSASV